MKTQLPLVVMLAVLAGCSPYAGTYHADARLIPGAEESTREGYTLADYRERVSGGKEVLTLERGGRFTWNTGSAVNEGTWRVEDGTLYLREDTYNGTPIESGLHKDRTWRVDPDGSFVRTRSADSIELVYTKQ